MDRYLISFLGALVMHISSLGAWVMHDVKINGFVPDVLFHSWVRWSCIFHPWARGSLATFGDCVVSTTVDKDPELDLRHLSGIIFFSFESALKSIENALPKSPKAFSKVIKWFRNT